MDTYTFGQRVADSIAAFGGSWTFIGIFTTTLFGWIFLNTWGKSKFDRYPFILLNLILSCLAAIQAPIIMMSQNRMATIDRAREARADNAIFDNVEKLDEILTIVKDIDEARRATDTSTPER